ncbi:unnamed protein product [Rotaria magnacalcarata]|uniref:Uncharacterized protein n=1 Tax=Rotaria magnacalcarata TaxID=392030 RepID=A0A819M8F8_9BILA|nr:unnamed protein product [Rotaria magnacalcarata]CAF2155682.1 unnamed protein product [Rotaria magnacalcarata]CAF3949281.1 unnamed protein product [Rotaria magnacalcarata]CAF3975281.1 unnamed protein product [Rotaria magnacalcarata]
MEPTKSNYTALSYGVPFGSFAVLFILISIINRRSNWFILGLILGIDKAKDDSPKPPHCVSCGSKLTSSAKGDQSKDLRDVDSKHLGYCATCKKTFLPQVKSNSNTTSLPESGTGMKCESEVNPTVGERQVEQNEASLEKYLYIDLKEDENSVPDLKCFIRVLSDVLTAAILAVFVSIIFENLILSNQTVKNGRKCPTFDADCFTTRGNYDVLPYSCIDGNYVNVSNYNGYVWCVAWVHQDQTAKDVLDTLGICGGLLGIVACIVPLVYYLSYNKNHNWLTCLCIVIPLSGFGGLAWMLWYTWDDRPSQLAITAFAVAISMMTIGWLWAVWRAFVGPNRCFHVKWCLKKRRCCKLCYCCCHIVCTKYKRYPWECLWDFWRYFCCCCGCKSYAEYESCPTSFLKARMELASSKNRVRPASRIPSTKEPYMI